MRLIRLFLLLPICCFTQIRVPQSSSNWERDQVGTIHTTNRVVFSATSVEKLNNTYSFSDTVILSSRAKAIFYFEANTQIEDITINGSPLNTSKAIFNSPPIAGDTFIIKSRSLHPTPPQLTLKEIGLIPIKRTVNQRTKKGFDGAGDCLININCTEGDAWQKQKRSVVKIHSRVLGRIFECSGVLINNTLENNKRYVLTAEHCANVLNTDTYSSQEDLNKWNFYFNYESPNCWNPDNENSINYGIMTGANFIAQSEDRGGEYGSDFFLVELQDAIPESYNVYLAGWYSEDIPASNGVTIHHPKFDVKKISTFNSSAVSDESIEGTPDAHWRVQWAATQNGVSITEGGSSGAPLFNKNGLVVGTLNGGQSSCDNLTGNDWFGKLAYSWESNGAKETQKLRNYLAPNSTITSLQGKEYDTITDSSSPSPIPQKIERVYPNPTSNILNIEGESFEKATLYSLTGTYINTFESSPIALSNLPIGSYLLVVEYSSTQTTFKIIKI